MDLEKTGSVLTDEQLILERKNLCIRLREVRKKQGLRLKKVAEDMGVTQSVISRHENGKTPFGLDTLIKFVRYYGVENFFV